MIGEVDMADKPFKKLTWKLAVLAKCRQCAITSHEVKKCPCKDCALWHFRLGKSPKDDVNALDLRVFSDDEDILHILKTMIWMKIAKILKNNVKKCLTSLVKSV